MILSVLFLSITLSIDALGIGLTYGLRKIRLPFFSVIIVMFISMFFAGSAILIGDVLLQFIEKDVARIAGSVMIFVMGIFVIIKALCSNEDFDFDMSHHIDAIEAIYLGTATSLDAFTVGIGSSISGLNYLYIPIFVAVFQIAFLCAGVFFGEKVSKITKLSPLVFSVLSGLLLIVIAISRIMVN